MERPIVGLWSDANPLSVATVEKLLANFCSVIIFSKSEKDWLAKTSHIKNRTFLLITKEEDSERSVDYSLIIDLSKTPDLGEKIGQARYLEEKYRAKTLLVLSYREVLGNYRKYKIPQGLGVIYAGDLFGPRLDLKENLPLTRIIKSILLRKQIEVSESEIIYPVFISSLARLIARWLFSFGPYGNEVAVFSGELSTLDFGKIIYRVVVNSRFVERKREEKQLSIQVGNTFVN